MCIYTYICIICIKKLMSIYITTTIEGSLQSIHFFVGLCSFRQFTLLLLFLQSVVIAFSCFCIIVIIIVAVVVFHYITCCSFRLVFFICLLLLHTDVASLFRFHQAANKRTSERARVSLRRERVRVCKIRVKYYIRLGSFWELSKPKLKLRKYN